MDWRGGRGWVGVAIEKWDSHCQPDGSIVCVIADNLGPVKAGCVWVEG